MYPYCIFYYVAYILLMLRHTTESKINATCCSFLVGDNFLTEIQTKSGKQKIVKNIPICKSNIKLTEALQMHRAIAYKCHFGKFENQKSLASIAPN